MTFEKWWGALHKDGLELKTGVEMCRVIAHMAWEAALRPEAMRARHYEGEAVKDLIERLHGAAKYSREFGRHNNAPLLDEAAIEISRLRHDLDRAMANHNADLNK